MSSSIDSDPGKLFPEQQKTGELEEFVLQGEELIKTGKYSEAKRHFKNPERAKKFGIEVEPDPREFIIPKDLEPHKIPRVANEVACNSWHMRQEKRIILSDISCPGQVLPEKLNHEIVLIYLEEWLHCLQDQKGGVPLAGYNDSEIDVAAYMIKHRIPLTPTFLNRYGRYHILTPHRPDIASTGPDIKSGTPATVTRSNGKVENDWHIERYDPTTGNVLVTKGNLTKRYPPEKLYQIARP